MGPVLVVVGDIIGLQIHGASALHVVGQNSLPSLGWWPAGPGSVFPDRSVAYLDAEFGQLSLNARLAPGRVELPHVHDEVPNGRVFGPALPSFQDRTPPMPAPDFFWLYLETTPKHASLAALVPGGFHDCARILDTLY